MSYRKLGESRDSSLGKVVLDDLRRTSFQSVYKQELRDLYRFYLDEDSRAKLAGMGRIQRSFWILGWLLKSLLLKLSPGRRLALMVSLVLAVLGPTTVTLFGRVVSADLRPWGFVLLLVVLMLELKDKLVARDEIEVARSVQLALLPQRQPEIPGWEVWTYTRPANDVGGDLVDYVEASEHRHGVALGDVAGKGLGAALLSAKLQATLRALAPECPALDELGERLNSILNRDGLDNRFATLFYAELYGERGFVRVLNAGHNPAYLVRNGGADIQGIEASSLPLGMMPCTRYREGSVELMSGDALVAYSDGLTEATNAMDEEYGPERLKKLLCESRNEHLAPHELGLRVLTEVEQFTGGLRYGDDLSLVVIRKL
ncbi:hypothetical protein ABI59_12430 [Acidobacteria bacterium Mor1]|nr:hypothetical protein ABI59_12430 [Acidobacteria bacterium Mor1]